jgi:peptidoglycan/LPS O-acetylase OafA/YrhL
MASPPQRRWQVTFNVLLALVVAVLCVLAGIYAIIKDRWYYAPILWVLALAALAYARSKGHVRIETPLFKYEGNLAEEEVPRRFRGEEEADGESR